MMNFSTSYTFRLLIPLCIGITLTDILSTHWGAADFHGWRMTDLLLMFTLAASLGLLILLCILIKTDKSIYKEKYGITVAALAMTLGSCMYSAEYRATYTDWGTDPKAYYGNLFDRPTLKKKHLRCKVDVKGRQVLLYLPDDSLARTLQRGDEILFYGRITCSDTSRYARIYFHQGIAGSAFVRSDQWRPTGRRHPLTLRQKALAWRDRIVAIYRSWGMQGDQLAVLSALTVGQTDELTTDLRGEFSAAGISHVLALSGLHVGLIWGVITLFFPPYIKRRSLRCIRLLIIASLLTLYVFMAGLPPSAVRAVWMCIIWEANNCFSEEYTHRLHALLAVVFLLLLVRPFYLFQLSFQLSVMAVGTILAFYEPIQEYFHKLWGYRGSRLMFLVVPVVAQLGVAPISLYYFHTFPVYFMLTSLFAVWLAESVVYYAMILLAGTGLSALWSYTNIGVLTAGWGWIMEKGETLMRWMVGGLIGMAQWVSRLPHAVGRTEGFTLVEVAGMYLFIVLLYRWVISPTRRRALLLFLGGDIELALWLFR
jgi:competence protein ComEC